LTVECQRLFLEAWMSPRKKEGSEGPVTPERVVDAALNVIDEDGLDALTMRRLAHDLGVEPVTVYRHLPNKEAILAAVGEVLWQEIRPEQRPGEDWRGQVKAMWLGLYAVMRAHPNAIPVIAKGGTYSASAAAGVAGMVAILRDAGLSPDQAGELMHVLSACMVGFGFAMVWGREIAAGGRPDQPAGEPAAPPPAELLPYLERMGRWEPGEFAVALDIVLDAYGATGERSAVTGR
jgi:TetR/AcrR family transcriptional regulator, tetracycline repressor protein